MNSKTKDTVTALRYPTTKTELRSLLGLCSVYRRFAPRFAGKAAPLNEELRKEAPKKSELNENECVAVNELKQNLTEPPALSLTKTDQPFGI